MRQLQLEQTGAITEHTGAINGLHEGTGALPPPDRQEDIKPDLVFQPETGEVGPRRQVEELIDFFPPENSADLSTKDGSFERLVTVARAVDSQRERLAELYGEEAAGVMAVIAQGAIFGSGNTAIDAAKIHGHKVPNEIPPEYSAFVRDALVFSAADSRDPEQAKSAAFVLTGKNSRGQSYTPTPTAAMGPTVASNHRSKNGVHENSNPAAENILASDAVSQGSGLGHMAVRQLTKV